MNCLTGLLFLLWLSFWSQISQHFTMFLTLEEVIKWVGITLFEIWLHLFCVLIFTVLIVLRIEQATTTSWWNIFIPLFLADGLDAYFCLIVFIRTWKISNHRVACLRLLSSALLLVCLFVSEFLFCQKLTNTTSISYSEAFAAVFIALQLLMVRACQTH